MMLESPASEIDRRVIQMRNARHLDFDRDRDLLFNLFCRSSRPLRNHLNIIVRNVRIRLDRKIVKRNHAPAEEQNRRASTSQRLFSAKSTSAAESLLRRRILHGERLHTTFCPGCSPAVTSC